MGDDAACTYKMEDDCTNNDCTNKMEDDCTNNINVGNNNIESEASEAEDADEARQKAINDLKDEIDNKAYQSVIPPSKSVIKLMNKFYRRLEESVSRMSAMGCIDENVNCELGETLGDVDGVRMQDVEKEQMVNMVIVPDETLIENDSVRMHDDHMRINEQSKETLDLGAKTDMGLSVAENVEMRVKMNDLGTMAEMRLSVAEIAKQKVKMKDGGGGKD